MGDSKADAIKEQAKIKADEAEEKVKGTISDIEKSKVAKHIPTSIEKLSFLDVIKVNIFLMGISIIPVYLLVVESSLEKGIIADIVYVMKFFVLIFGCGGLIFDMLVVYGRMSGLFKFVLLIKFVKICSIVICAVLLKMGSLFNRTLSISYFSYVTALDLLFIYYLAIFFKRTESDEYDESGDKKVQSEKKEEV